MAKTKFSKVDRGDPVVGAPMVMDKTATILSLLERLDYLEEKVGYLLNRLTETVMKDPCVRFQPNTIQDFRVLYDDFRKTTKRPRCSF